jgi:hypothetical protein
MPDSPLPSESPSLSSEEFDSLLKSLQLLRISQLRYLVQRFSIPVSGNKTKLLGLIISIFHSLRHDPVLVEALAEVNRLLEQPSDIFSNPIASVGRLEIVAPNPGFWAPLNPVLSQQEPPFLFGPILVPPGQSTGKFAFTLPPLSHSVNISFLFQDGEPSKVAFSADLNSFSFEITANDPFPNPIDVTHALAFDQSRNILEIKSVASSAPLMICVREFRFVGLSLMAEQVCARKVHMSERVMVLAKGCEPHDPFDLLDFLSAAVATGRWFCPVCNRPIDIGQLTLAHSSKGGGSDPLPVGLFAPGAEPEYDWF